VATGDTIIGGLNAVDFSADSYVDLNGEPIVYKVNVTNIKTSNTSSITGIAVDPNDPERVAISIGGYSNNTNHVMLSENGQSTNSANSFSSIWSSPGGVNGIERMPVYSVTFDINNPGRIIAGTEYGIFVSEDDGDEWVECNNTGLEGGIGRVPVMELLQQTLENTWNFGQIYAGTHGRGFWESGEYLVNVGDIEEEVELISQLSIYPNPVSDVGTVSFNLEKRNDVVLSIYDISGNLISAQSKMNMSAGQRTLDFNAADLANGIYIIHIRVQDQVQFGKFVKL